MINVNTDWVECGVRQRRAKITAPNSKLAGAAKEYYESVTHGVANTTLMICERAIRLKRDFSATVEHEYNPA